MCCNVADQASSARVSPSNSNSHSPSLSSSLVTVATTSTVALTNQNILSKKASKVQAANTTFNKLMMMNKIGPSQVSISSQAASGGSGSVSSSTNLGLASGSLQDLKQQHKQQHCSGSGIAMNANNSGSINRASTAQSRPISSKSGASGSRRHNLSIENLAAAAAARRNQASSNQLPAYATNRTMLLIAQNQHIPQAQLDDQHSGQLFANMLSRTTRQIQQQQQLQLQQQQPISFSSSSLNSCQSSQQQPLQATMSHQQQQQQQQHHLTHSGSIKVNQDSSSSALSKHRL